MSTDRLAPTGVFVGGVWRPANGGAEFEVTDPGTDEQLAMVADGTVSDANAAMDAAAAALPRWSATPPRERGEVLRRAYELMIGRTDELARLITLEMGKSYAEGRGEVAYAAEFLRWFSEEACRAQGGFVLAPSGQYQLLTKLQPVGVSVLVTPWNFPAAMATRKIGPALAAGCTTVLKPAQETPLTALAMAEVFAEAGVPEGVVNVVPTSNASETVAAMMSHPAARKISFTGSTQVGRILLKQAADQVLRTSMELGGNAPFLVFEDADIDLAVDNAMIAKLRNVGQSCVAANRFHVHEAVVDEFSTKLAERMQASKVGHGMAEGAEVGTMITRKARDRVGELIADARSRGAELLCGGEPIGDKGAFLAPTLLRDVPADARCFSEEVFGPMAGISTFSSDDEALALANGTPFGLAAYVQKGDLKGAFQIAERIEAGMVGLNRGVISDPAAPFGGMKQSGLGREGAHEGLMEYLEVKYIGTTW